MGHLVQNVHVYASAQSASQPRNIIDHHDQLRPHRHTTSTSKNFHMARPTGKYHVGFTNFTYLARNYTIQQDQLVDPQKVSLWTAIKCGTCTVTCAVTLD